MGILLGGPKCFGKRVKGDLAIFFEWFDPATDEIGKGEPAMMITRRDKLGLSGNRGSATIMLDAAYKYADSRSGNPTRRLLKFSMDACVQLGLEPSKMNTYKIADAIVENLPDLLRMPPAPNPDKFTSRRAPSLGEAKLVQDGKVISEGEVLH